MRRILLTSIATVAVASVIVVGAIGVAFAVVPAEQSSAVSGVAAIELEQAPAPTPAPTAVETDAPAVAPPEVLAPTPAPSEPAVPDATPTAPQEPESVDPQRPHGLGGRGDNGGGARWEHDGDTADGDARHWRDDRPAGRQDEAPGGDGWNGEHSGQVTGRD